MGKLKREAEKAKRAVSSQMSARVEIEAFFDGEDFSETLTRAKFEELNLDLFKRTIKPVEQVMKDANIGKHEIHDIVLVGGSTRIPKVIQLLEDFFNGKKASKGINPDEAVAYGAAVQGGILAGEDKENLGGVVLLDVCPLTLGIETTGGVMAKWVSRFDLSLADFINFLSLFYQDHWPQHPDPDQEIPNLLDRGRQPAHGLDPSVRGRASDDEGQPLARQV
jgi:heat shock protein 5